MNLRSTSVLRLSLLIVFLAGTIYRPQFGVSAAANMTITPITWNVVGLDSNNVAVGPNNFPVGARVCNTSTAGETLTNLTADFVWDDGQASDPYINLRSGSQDPISVASLAPGACVDFYFELTITRNAAAYDQTRDYHINVTSTQTGATIFSTPTPREIYVERLVSQNRNSVTDIRLDGVSIAAGGTMNLLVGNTYTIQLVGATATNGYEQIESFINFPNTIFRINSVTATYSAFPTPHTDPNWASKLYTDGCGWVNDPNDVTAPAYRECTGTGKYGGDITITYNVTIIGGGGTNQTLNTLIYDFSGSSYHYNSDYSTSSRIAAITDPASCSQTTITQWTFTGNVATPATGTGTFTAGSALTSVATIAAGNPGPSLSAQSWSQTEAIGANAYYQFAVPTTGYSAIHFNFDANSSNNAFDKMTIYYSTDGINYTQFGGTNTISTTFAPFNSDMSTITGLDNNSAVRFRIYGFSSDNVNRALRVDNVTVTGCALPASMNLAKTITAGSPYSTVGALISYQFAITNTGGSALTGITLGDDKSANEACPATTLAIGASMTCTATYAVTQADLDTGSITNIATADSNQTTPITDQATATATQTKSLTLDKTTTTTQYNAVGDAISYSYLLTNNGNVTLYAPYAIADNRTTAACPATPTSLAPGASVTCTATYTVVAGDISAGSVTNTANGTAKDASSGGNDVTSNSDSVTVPYVAPPAISKSFSPDPITVNGTSTLTFTITNPNTAVSLTGVGFTDPLPAGLQVASPPNVSAFTGCGAPTFTPAGGDFTLAFSGGTIAANGSCTFSVNVMATTTGLKSNTTGSVTSTNGGTGNTASDTLTVNNPSFTIAKNADVASVDAAGDVINYAVTLTNTGDVGLTGVSVSDPLLANLDCDGVAGLPFTTMGLTINVGATLTCTGTYTVIQADIDNNGGGDGDIDNTVTGDTIETAQQTASEVVTITQTPVHTTVKTETSGGPYAVSDTITYNIVVTNTGNVTLTNVGVSDNSAIVGTCTPAQPSTLAPNATMTCPATHVVTQADVDAGSYVNTATGDSDQTTPNTSTVTVNFTRTPAHTTVKTETSTGPYGVGDTVAYSIAVTNTGNVTLTGVTVSDNSATVGTCTPAQPSTLAPNATMTCPATHVVTQAGVDNGSYVNTATGDSDQTMPNTSTVTVNFAQIPALTLTKTANPASVVAVGEIVTYTFSVQNSGNVTLANITLTDTLLTGLNCAVIVSLTPGASQSFSCTGNTYAIAQTDIDNNGGGDGDLDNTATATGTPPSGPNVSDDDSEAVTLPVQAPAHTTVKTETSTGPYAVGDTITYNIVVTNTGNITLTGVTVSDNSATVGICAPAQPTALAPNATMTCPASHVVTQADVDAGSYVNTATGDSDQTASSASTVTVNFTQNPAHTTVKTEASTGPYAVGDTISYSIVVTNTGNVSLTGVTITDNAATVGTCTPAQPTTLAPNATMTCPATYLVTQADVDAGNYVNTATGDSDQTLPNTSTVTVTFLQTPGLTLTKTTTPATVTAAGDIVAYSFSVQNVGNVTLTNVTITDGLLTGLNCAVIASLAPGATQSFTCAGNTYTVTQTDLDNNGGGDGDIDNTATATGTTPGGGTTSATDSAAVTLPVQAPAHTTTKTESSTGPYAAGDTITYSITVTNTGNITLTGVTMADNSATVGACTPVQPSTLAPGASMTCLAGHVVTQANVDAGSYANTATGDSDQTIPSTSTVTVTFAQNPAHTTAKTETSVGPYAVGDTITYNIVVTNTGDVTLTGVTVTDGSATIGACTPAQPSTLAPNGAMTCPASHVVTQGDVDNGSYVNTATGDSDQTTPGNSTVTVNFAQTPAHTTVKTETSVGPYGVGDTITYNIIVTNTGNVTLTGVTVSDNSATLGTCTPAQPSTLATNGVMTCPASHVVSQADVDSGSYVNTATGDSDQTTPNTSTVTVNFIQAPAHTTVKTETSVGPYGVGDTITYNIIVTNTGNVTLTGVTVSDNSATLGTCTPAQPSNLAPSATMACPASHVVTQADVDNGSYVNTASGDSDQTAPNTSIVTVNLTQTPAHTTVKTEASTGPYAVGDTISYSIVVTNTGNITLTGVTVTDNSAAVGVCVPAQPSTLAPNATMTCSASHVVAPADLTNGSYVNTATGDTDQTAPRNSTVTVNFAQAPSFSIGKVADVASVDAAGDVITYTVTLANTGNIPLTGVSVNDPLLANLDCDGAAGAPFTTTGLTMAVNGSLTCTGTHTVTQADLDTDGGGDGDIDNTVTGDTNETGLQTTSAVVTITQAPAHTTVKTETSAGPYAVGDTVTYNIVVTNTGNITLTGVTVADNSAIMANCTPAQPSTLAPNATMTCPASHAVTQADVDSGSYANTATGDSDQTTPGTSTVTVTFAQNPSLNIVKEVSTDNSTWNDISVTVAAGDTVYYRVRVANTGNVTLTGLAVSDNRCTLLRGTDITGDNDNDFEVGEEWVYTCSVTAVLGTVNNTATADTNETSPDNDSASYTAAATLAADPALSKAGTPAQASVGETVSFTITVTNAGNAPAPNVVITDPLPAMFDVTAVTVTGAPFGTSVNVTPPIGTGPAPYTVAVTLGGDLGVTDVVTIEIVTTVNGLGNPPVSNAASLTTTAAGDVTANNSDSVSISLRATSTTSNQPRQLPATGFAPNVETVLPPQPQSLAYAATDVILEIPSLGVKIPIVGIPKKNGTWDVTWLGNQAGWLEGSAFPSWKGNSVLTSHVYLANGLPGPFVDLGKLKFGDQIIVHAYGQKYIFEVQTSQVVNPSDGSALKHEEKSWLTLVTCKEYDEKTNTYKKRVVVRAVLVRILWDK